MKSFLVLALLVSGSAMAEYRFTGRHPIKLSANEKNEVIASLCYDDFRNCTSSIKIGTTQELSSFIQKQIFNRKDVTLFNFDSVMSQSVGILNSSKKDLMKRQNEQKKFAGGDLVKAEALKSYVDEAQTRVANAEHYVANLKEGKSKAIVFHQEFKDIMYGAKDAIFKRSFSYGVEDFLFRDCYNKSISSDCWHAGLQFFLTDRGVDQVSQLIAKAVRIENEKNGLPMKLSSGLHVALLSSDFTHAGTSHPSQTVDPVDMEVVDDKNAHCSALNKTGYLTQTKVGCESLGKNWRFPSLKELKMSSSEVRSVLPTLEASRLFQTSNVNGFINPGATYLMTCKPVYFNLTSEKSVNNQAEIVRSFIFGKDPAQGASAVCVCEKDC